VKNQCDKSINNISLYTKLGGEIVDGTNENNNNALN